MPLRLLLGIFLLLASVQASVAAGKVALVLSNAKYQHVNELFNPPKDAAAIVEALHKAGFENVKLVENADMAGMTRSLQDFAALADTADVAMIYFAGHGVEVGDENFLIPVNARLAKSSDVHFEAVQLALVRQAVSGADKIGIVVLDACRNNPFKLASAKGGRSAGRGLAAVETTGSELIAYSAKEGTIAQDGPQNGNSPFATAMIKALGTPKLEIRLLFGQIKDDVVLATDGEQEPFVYTSLGGKPFFLNENEPPAAQNVALQGNESRGIENDPAYFENLVANCGSAKTLKSHVRGKAVTIQFVNKSNGKRIVNWVDFKGNLVKYMELNPGASYHQQTFTSHPWVFTDSRGKCVDAMWPSESKLTFVLGRK